MTYFSPAHGRITADGSAVPANFVGQQLFSQRLSANAISMASGTYTDICNLTLPAGYPGGWEVTARFAVTNTYTLGTAGYIGILSEQPAASQPVWTLLNYSYLNGFPVTIGDVPKGANVDICLNIPRSIVGAYQSNPNITYYLVIYTMSGNSTTSLGSGSIQMTRIL